MAAGFVERASDPTDGRRVLIGATEKGARVASELRRRRDAWLDTRLDTRLDALTPAERWEVFVFAGPLGCVVAFDSPARQTLVLDLVTLEHRFTAGVAAHCLVRYVHGSETVLEHSGNGVGTVGA